MACRTEGSGFCQQLCPAALRRVPSGGPSASPATRCSLARHRQLCEALCQRVLEISNAAAALSLAVIGGSLSVSQDARPRAGAARASPGGTEAGRRCRIVAARAKSAFQCSALGCLRLPANLIPDVAFFGFCHKRSLHACRHCWLSCLSFIQKRGPVPRSEGVRLRSAPLGGDVCFARARGEAVPTFANNHVQRHFDAAL